MEVVKKEIDDLNAEIVITIEEADYKTQVENSLKDYRRTANMPGFRKGHVPLGMVRKMVGTNMLVDEVNKLLNDKIHGFITDEKLDILGNPLPKEDDNAPIDWKTQKDFSFTYEIGIAPEVKVGLSEKNKFEKYKIQVSDKMVDEQIDEIAKRYGKMVEVDESKDEDMLYGKFEELEDGKVKEGGIAHDTVLNIRTIEKKKDQKAFVGLKKGELVKKVKPQDIAAANFVAAWLSIEEQYIADQKSDFQFTVEKINRMEAAELNQEFFDKIYGKDQVKNKAEMTDRIRKEMETSFGQNAEQLFEREVQDYLMDKAKLNLPDDFMKRWLKTANKENLTDEQIESDYEQYALGIRWQLIENSLLKDNDIKIEHKEVIDYTKELISQQLGGMGQNMMEDKELEETALRILQNEDESRKIFEQLSSSRLRKFYNETVKIKEKEIDYEDFVKLVDKKKHKH